MGDIMIAKHILAASACVFALAHAASAATFTNVTYTANSLAFTITGTITEAIPAGQTQPTELSFVYNADIWDGPDPLGSVADSENHAVSGSPFSNRSVSTGTTSGQPNTGRTGVFGSFSDNAYSWVRFDSALTGATGNGTEVTISWTSDYLDINAAAPSIDIYIGSAFVLDGDDVYLGTVAPTVASGGSAVVPVPAALPLLMGGLGALTVLRRRRRA